jgi:hypothetical protein
MKVDKEVLIKNHFWILMILVLLLPLICLLVLWTSASAKVEDAEKSVKAVDDKLNKITSPKNKKFEDVLKEKDEKVDAQKIKIWKAAWEAQAGMITWPDTIEGADKLNEMYFGDPIHRDWEFSYDKVAPYQAQYDANTEIILPVKSPTVGQVQYLGGPEAVVPVSFKGKWNVRPPDADEMWFLQEDLAIQRELLQIIRDTNDMIATFHKVSGAAKPDKSKGEIDHQIFTNSDFKLDLVLAEEKGKKTFRCLLTNISNRRQPLSYIPFVVSIKGLQDPQYFWADGEPLAPNASFTVKHKEKDKEEDWVLQTQSGTLQAGTDVLQGVMQVYDWRTAPIKRLDKVLMGVSSSRTVAPLLPPLFEKKDEPAPTLGGGDTSGGGETGGGMMQRMGKVMGERGGALGMGASSADKTKNGLDKNRYISVSKQVRRMPVALALVIDQAHMQDFLTVAANSKLRIQTTEVYWQRFHDDIKPTFKDEGKPGEETPGGKTPSSTSSTTPRGPLAGKGAMAGAMGPERGGMGPGGNNIGMMMLAMRGRMAMAGQMGMGRMGTSTGKMGMSEFAGPGRGRTGFTMPTGPILAPGAAPDTIEPEEESSLVHLAFYGIASIYERFPPKKEGTETTSTTSP